MFGFDSFWLFLGFGALASSLVLLGTVCLCQRSELRAVTAERDRLRAAERARARARARADDAALGGIVAGFLCRCDDDSEGAK